MLLVGLFEGLNVPGSIRVALPILGAMFGMSYMVARTVFRWAMRRRYRVLNGLLERITAHVAATGSEAEV